MGYPATILPQPGYKALIEDSMDGFTLCRSVAHPLHEEELFFLPLEIFTPKGYQEFFGYSLNLPQPDKFQPEHCRIELIGSEKRRFYEYWTPEKEPQLPIEGESYRTVAERSWFFLPFSEMSGKVNLPKPLRVSKGNDDTLRLKIHHAPTCCNYWHYEFRWLDKDGRVVNANESSWKKEISATLKSIILEHLLLESPENPVLAEHVYKTRA